MTRNFIKIKQHSPTDKMNSNQMILSRLIYRGLPYINTLSTS